MTDHLRMLPRATTAAQLADAMPELNAAEADQHTRALVSDDTSDLEELVAVLRAQRTHDFPGCDVLGDLTQICPDADTALVARISGAWRRSTIRAALDAARDQWPTELVESSDDLLAAARLADVHCPQWRDSVGPIWTRRRWFAAQELVRAVAGADLSDADVAALVGPRFDNACMLDDAALSWFHLGSAFGADGRTTEAVDAYREAERRYTAIGNALQRGNTRYNLGGLLVDEQQWTQAAETYSAAMNDYESVGRDEDVGDAAVRLGYARSMADNDSDSAAIYMRAVEAYDRAERIDLAADAAERRGNAEARLNRHRDAAAAYADAHRRFNALGESIRAASNAQCAGWRYHSVESFSDAVDFYSVAAEIYAALERMDGVADCAIGHGNALCSLESFDAAAATFTKAARTVDAAGLTERAAQLFRNAGWALERGGRSAEAVVEYAGAIERFGRVEDHLKTAECAARLCDLLDTQGSDNDADHAYEMVCTGYTLANEHEKLALASFLRAERLGSAGRADAAMRCWIVAADKYVAAGQPKWAANAHLGLANSLVSAARPAEAAREYRASAELFLTSGLPVLAAGMLVDAGHSYPTCGDHRAAEADFRAALTIYQDCDDDERVAETLDMIAAVQHEAGLWSDAIASCLSAEAAYIRAGLHDRATTTMANRGVSHWAAGELGVAATLLGQARDQHNESGRREDAADLEMRSLSKVLAAHGRTEAAAAAYRSAAQAYADLGLDEKQANALEELGTTLMYQRATAEAAREAFEAAQHIHLTLGATGDAASCWTYIGVTLLMSGRPEVALAAVKSARDLYHSIGDEQHEGESRRNLGSMLAGDGRLSEALVEYRVARELDEHLGNVSGVAQSTRSIAELHVRLGDLPAAYQEYSTVAEYDSLPTELAAQIRLGLGKVLVDTGQPGPAEAHLREALEGFDALSDRRQAAFGALHLARALKDLDHCDEALERVRQATAGFHAVDDARGVASCLKIETLIHVHAGRLEEAEITAEGAISAFERLPDSGNDLGGCLQNLGGVMQTTGRWSDALTAYSRAAVVFARGGNDLREFGSKTMMAFCRAHLGDYPAAERLYRDALTSTAGAKHRSIRTESTFGIIDILRETGRYREALSMISTAREQFADDCDHEQLVRCDQVTAIIYHRTGRMLEAEEVLSRVHRRYEKLFGTSELTFHTAQTSYNLGHVLKDTGRKPEAERLYRDARAYFVATNNGQMTAVCDLAIGNICAETKRFGDAERHLLQALDAFHRLATPHAAALCTMNLARRCYDMGRYDDAIERCNEARSRYSQLGAHDDRANVDLLHAFALHAQAVASPTEKIANLIAALDIALPAVIYLDCQRFQFDQAAARASWSRQIAGYMTSLFSLAHGMKNELLVAELVEASVNSGVHSATVPPEEQRLPPAGGVAESDTAGAYEKPPPPLTLGGEVSRLIAGALLPMSPPPRLLLSPSRQVLHRHIDEADRRYSVVQRPTGLVETW